VDHDQFVFTKSRLSKKYDIGTIDFRAKKGKLIDLDKVHESIWATRLSGGTSSGVTSLEVTAVGKVAADANETVLRVLGADRQFVLVDDVNAKPENAKKSRLKALREATAQGDKVVTVTGYVDGWVGRWPAVLRTPPAKRPRIMVTSFQIVQDQEREGQEPSD
jgi:hypothetical protein